MDNDDFSGLSEAFLSWLSNSSATISPKIAIHDLRSRSAGRGVVAVQGIAEDELLFSVPRGIVLSVANSDLSKTHPEILKELTDPWLSLILVLIYEYLRGDASPWKPYFDVLPPDFHTLMFWTTNELSELQASAVIDKIGKERADITLKENVVSLIRKNADMFFPPGSNQLSDAKLLSLAHRMGSTIMAYAFDIGSDETSKEVDEEGYASEDEDEALPKGMVPMADMLNADADRNNARLFYETNSLTMKALKPIPTGEEIFNDYGPLPRSDLLRRYGYITPNYAKHDVVEVSAELVLDVIKTLNPLQEQEIDLRNEYLDSQDLLENSFDISRMSPELETSVIPDELVLFTTIFLADTSTFAQLQRSRKLPKSKMTKPIAEVLEKVLKRRLAQYPTGVEEDRILLSAGGLEHRKRMAVEVRLGEKEVLMETLQALKGVKPVIENGENKTAARSGGDNDRPDAKRRKIA